LGWPRVQETLQALIDEGVLFFAGDADLGPLTVEAGDRDDPLPPAPCATPRTWREPQLMSELTGAVFDPAHLELVTPIFRLAHPALDADGRQVGEANVFPKSLRLPAPTLWRACVMEGSRHQAEKPMNVTALKAMRAHWGAMMQIVAAARSAYMARFPETAQGWTTGHVERLAASILAIPTWLMMRPERPVANGRLHPALSCVFRVTDGVRMVTHQMMFVPGDAPMRRPDAPVTARDIHAFAERAGSFHSEHGVCAGPAAMVDEFLAVLIDGAAPRGGFPEAVDPQVAEALAEVDQAIDYALLGLQGHAAVFAIWPAMAEAFDRLAEVGQSLSKTSPVADRLTDWGRALKRRTYLGERAYREHRAVVYSDMFAMSAEGLSGRHAAPRALPEGGDELSGAFQSQMTSLIAVALGEDVAAAPAIAEAVCVFAGRTRRLLAAAEEAQDVLNALLQRPAAGRSFSAADADLHNVLQGEAERRVPFLPTALEALFEFRLHIDAKGVVVEPVNRFNLDPRLDAGGVRRLIRAVST